MQFNPQTGVDELWSPHNKEEKNMEEIVQASTGVESAQVADVQSQDTSSQESYESPASTGVETPDVAGQVRDEKDFSAAFKARETQVRQQIEKEYSTKLEETKAQAQHLEYLAEINGFSDVKEYIQAITEHKSQQQIRAEAAKLGVDERVIKEHLQPMKQELEQLRQEREQFRTQEQSRQLQSELDRVINANPDFHDYFPKIEELYQKGYSIEDAYRLASYEDKLSKLSVEKEQEVLARVTGRDQKQVLSSNDKPNNLAFTPSNMSTKDIMDISARVQRGERITFK